MKLWTVSLDYHATGEGRTLFGWIGYADGEQSAIDRFGQAFDPYFARGANAAEGIVEDRVVCHLFSQQALQEVRQLNGCGNLELVGSLHFNLA